MSIKNKKILHYLVLIFLFSTNIFITHSDEFEMTASVINVDKENETVQAEGSVVVTDDIGNIITADESKYFKKEEVLEAYGSVVITDTKNNKITSDKVMYDQKTGKIYTFDNSKVFLDDGYEVTSDSLIYDTLNDQISSNEYSNLIDLEDQSLSVEMFQYSTIKKIFASKGLIEFIDNLKNKHYFDEVYLDTGKKKLTGSRVRVNLNRNNIIEANKENHPRFVANSAVITTNKSFYKGGAYTLCRKRANGKCPPWTLQAKKITHDKKKKTIYYDNSWVKIYDIPVFYFPKFFHPDPSVDRQSGFLRPSFTESDIMGSGVALPYFFDLGKNKDLTFTPKFFLEENPLFLAEYRHVTKNSSTVLDFGYAQGYKSNTSKRTKGSRNHMYLKSDLDLDMSKFDTSDLNLKIQRANNSTYFTIYDINTAKDAGATGLVEMGDTTLENEIKLNLKKDSFYLTLQGNVYEDITVSSNTRYEYILPTFNIGNKLYSSDKVGSFWWDTQSYHRNYSVDQETSMLINDITWNANQKISKKGYLTEMETIIKNVNYDADGSGYKSDHPNHEISGVFSLTRSLPLQKEDKLSINTLTPKIKFRYAPGHMRDLGDNTTTLSATNLFATNKLGQSDVIESGSSIIFGVDFNTAEKSQEKFLISKKFEASLGQIYNLEKNPDMSSMSSLNRSMSDTVGNLKYNFNEESNVNYKFSIDNNMSTLTYNELSTSLNYGFATLNVDYLEEEDDRGDTNYMKGGLTVNITDTNSLSFSTRKNFQTSSTEYHNMYWQYLNDCFRARLEFNRTFYSDQDVEPSDSLKMTFSILPYYQYTTGNLSNTGKQLEKLK
ncbi:MAG: hypothetical protein CBC24_01330 [Candidatus Pelagibacter sp. TMED64]|nr:hypothetical protein [Candidatus Pelagibacter sp.]OUU67324.1 MAG: hypothetical protein CBC24_01330 [Candidatus Pelagibacter sp. TMED64]|tara:strand:- start:1528 stop:4023 length:2496 start_codon:yes stop_codon:yes gene_type:complete